MNIYQYKSAELQFKDIDEQSMTVAGYFSAFDKVDAYNEVAVKGSFSKSIQENYDRIKFLLNHDVTKSLGPLKELREDDYGLFYRAEVLPTTFGKDFMIMAKGGVIKEHSIGYVEVKSHTKSGIKYITEHKLMEGSALTGWGVNQYTPMVSTMKSQTAIADRIKTLETFCRNTEATDETIQMLLLEIKQLNQLISDIQATQPAVNAVEPGKKAIDWTNIIQTIKKI
jgi:HK97 family phage prohead protease